MRVLQWAWRTLRQRGATQAWLIVRANLEDLLFDWRHGTDTMRWVEQPVVTTGVENRRHQGRYQATKERPLVALFELLNLSKDSTFVDVGSGKGRVLLIAARHGFRRVRGIEFSNELCRVCLSNVERFRRWLSDAVTIEVIEADATQYAYPPDEGVYFMYHPFDAGTLGRVLQRMAISLQAAPQKLTLIYNVPVHHEVVLASGLFASWRAHELQGSSFIVYETEG